MSRHRQRAIKEIAVNLALSRDTNWQRHPSGRQKEKQEACLHLAEEIVAYVEASMIDYRWELDS